MSDFFEPHKKGLVIRVRISPNSSSCLVNGVMEAADGAKMLKISLKSVPEKGKANKELMDFLAKKMQIPKIDIELLSGETQRVKKILLYGDTKTLKKQLYNWLGDMVDER